MSFRVGDDVRVDFAGEVVQADPLVIRASEGGVVWRFGIPVGALIEPSCGCGKPLDHIYADEDSDDWACLVPRSS